MSISSPESFFISSFFQSRQAGDQSEKSPPSNTATRSYTMAKSISTISNSVMICNTIFASDKGVPQTACCRVRGEVNGKSVKIPAWMFGAALPLPGEAVFVSEGNLEEDTASNYRTLRNGKVSIEVAHEAAPAAPEAHPSALIAEAAPEF
jgi:hypothetical protein